MSYNLFYIHNNIFDNQDVNVSTTVKSASVIEMPITEDLSVIDTSTDNFVDISNIPENVVSTDAYAAEEPLLTTVSYATTAKNETAGNLISTMSIRFHFILSIKVYNYRRLD